MATTEIVYAAYGLDDLAAGVLKSNRRNADHGRFFEKAASYRERWPWLMVEPPQV